MTRTFKTWGLSALTGALLALGAATQASAITTERFSGDTTFVDRCGGLDSFGCEWLVAEGRAGNRASTGTWERGFFDRISNAATNEQAMGGADFTIANPFTLSYDGAGTSSLTYLGGPLTISGIDFNTSYAGDNPTAPALSIYLRVRDASLSNLMLDTGSGASAVGGGPLLGVGSTQAEYLALGGFDVTSAWTLTGDLLLGTGNNSGSAFQAKITDLTVAPIPLPAGVVLLLSGLGGLVLLRKRQA